MPPRIEHQNKGRTRVSNACQRCRKHKIKCSGTIPCQTCDARGHRCEFSSDEKKIAISERALFTMRNRLNELERLQNNPQGRQQFTTPTHPRPDESLQLAQYQNPPSTTERYDGPVHRESETLPFDDDDEPLETASSREQSAVAAPSALSNPLVPEQPAYLWDSSGYLRYLGHSSTWAFTQQLLSLTRKSARLTPSPELPVYTEAEIYPVNATRLSLLPEELAGLPSLELSLFYMQSVKFRTYPLYYLFDEEDFVSNLHRFYESMATDVQEQRLWYVHFLLVIAFGKAFKAQTMCCLAGADFFNRALRLLPDTTFLSRDAVRSTEILCCIALYLQSTEHRNAAHIYIGQALRMAYSYGLHTDIREDTVGARLATRYRRLWWTVYTLDRRLNSSFGVPCGLRDADVTASYPAAGNITSSTRAQTIYVRICELLGRVITTVYGIEETLKKTFLSTAQEVLRGAASLADELTQFSESCVGEISRVAAHLNLAYRQCIILATRPILFHLLKTRLESSDPSRQFHLSSAVKGLVQVCINSAVQAASTLASLKQHELLDSFLYFDLESVFSAALVLVITSGVHPKLLPREDWLESCYEVFDHIAITGNDLAPLRKAEVEQLSRVREGLESSRRHHPKQQQSSISENGSQLNVAVAQISPTPTSIPDYSSIPSLGDPFFDEWIPDHGFSGAQMMDLADALNPQDLPF